jgi:hypothetical protein
VYSTSLAMLLTMVLSVYLFNLKPTLQVLVHSQVIKYKILSAYSICWLISIPSMMFYFPCHAVAFIGHNHLYDVTAHVFCPSKHACGFAYTSQSCSWEPERSSSWAKNRFLMFLAHLKRLASANCLLKVAWKQLFCIAGMKKHDIL